MDKGEGGRSLKKRKYIGGIVITILLIALIAGAAAGIMAYDRKKTQEAISIEHDIVFIYNEQESFADYSSVGDDAERLYPKNWGYFIDKWGNKCYFDLTDLSKEDYAFYDIDTIYHYLDEHIEEYEKIPFLKEEQVCEVYKYLTEMDRNAEFTVEYIAHDAGSEELYGIRTSENGEMEFILLEMAGVVKGFNADENLGSIMNVIGEDTWRDKEELWNHFR